MPTQIHIAETAVQVAEDFAQYFAEWVEDKPRVTLALSGGSTPKVLFRLWAEQYRDSIEWGKVHFFWGDERCVPPDDEESNFKMANGLFLSRIGIPEENIHRIRGESRPEEEARRYAEEIVRFVNARNGMPSFDMILLGMGSDGHTASIFPDQMELLSVETLCAVATHPESGQQRITLTGKVLNNAEEVAFLATGQGKAAMVKKIINGEADSQHFPAAHIEPSQGELHWFIDQDAAEGLKKG
ncbi:MAG: 6-phosphogluconolactonase [Phaeodactylibacter sp.]|nr:6-phosphogluconolactonase [Phaeodactylibacter sp.]MCB9266465.1 6-phosphogluconolactonase [Lewinellaceae bacterium]MCB9289067.1 6-phosphogluconolactonase [Lewinellaceae bacterium]